MKTKPTSTPDVLLMQRDVSDSRCWVCDACETENDIIRLSCEICGAARQERPDVRPAEDERSLRRSPFSSEQPVTQMFSGIRETAASFSESAPAGFLRQNWYKIAAALVVLGVGIGLLVHFSDYDRTHTLSDNSRLVYNMKYGNIQSVDYFREGREDPADIIIHNEDYSTVSCAIFNSIFGGPGEYFYFTCEGEHPELDSRRELTYATRNSVRSNTLYSADGSVLGMDEYFPDMRFDDGEYFRCVISGSDVSSGAVLSGSDTDGQIFDAAGANFYDMNELIDSDFSHLVSSKHYEYNDGRKSALYEYNEEGLKIWQYSYDEEENISDIIEYAYFDSGRVSYRCNTDRQRLSATEADGTHWTYHYNDNNEFVRRTRTVEYLGWNYSDDRISLAGYELNYAKLDQTLYNCIQFTYSFQISHINRGNSDGNFRVHVRDDKGKWTSVKTFRYVKENGQFPLATDTVSFDKPMNITGFAFLPSNSRDVSWGSYESCSNFVIQDTHY